MKLEAFDNVNSGTTTSAILQAISENDPLGLGKQIASALEEMKGVEGRIELFFPAYITAMRNILNLYSPTGIISREAADSISQGLSIENTDSQVNSQGISGSVLLEISTAISSIASIVGENLARGDTLLSTLFDEPNINSETSIREAVGAYQRALEISTAQYKAGMNRTDSMRVVIDTTPTLIQRTLEIATILDAVPFINKGAVKVTTENFIQ